MKHVLSNYWQSVLETARTHIPGVQVRDEPSDDEAFAKALIEFERDLDSGKLEQAYNDRLQEAQEKIIQYGEGHE